MSLAKGSDTEPRTAGAGEQEVQGDPSLVQIPKISTSWTVDGALDATPVERPIEGSSSPLPYFHLLERLKLVKREGWKRFHIQQGESIADHMYRMAMISMSPPATLAGRLDLGKCTKMCLIHDMAESVVGDITPADGIQKVEKNRREKSSMEYITQRLLGNVCGGILGKEICELWLEFEEGETLESRYVQDLDKIELLLQMVEYEKRGRGAVNLGEFTYVASKICLSEMKPLAEDILQDRNNFWSESNFDGGKVAKECTSSQMRAMQDQYYGEG